MRLLYRYVQITSRDGYPIDYLSIFLDNTVSLGSIVLKGQWLDSIPKSCLHQASILFSQRVTHRISEAPGYPMIVLIPNKLCVVNKPEVRESGGTRGLIFFACLRGPRERKVKSTRSRQRFSSLEAHLQTWELQSLWRVPVHTCTSILSDKLASQTHHNQEAYYVKLSRMLLCISREEVK
ncbi:unnamed protein product [Fusarium graminearum]|uniref:Uncharacterized protein n=1 Tax=Gibberella zeae TaxID=5518 RepID=A0A4E9ECV3_GIBZA|nr:unnamed protein product [Fusarium graminearum]CAF3610587.1 unnamed protein product [Fusarium graminearum]CAG2000080.1 unnamed protein product [Fusarium graminearum]CAG2014578.1 unnamed protein product [Fusarium graminearum]